MHIYINFILLQEFDVEYYSICFILILKVEFYSKMKWKCIFSEISPQRDPLRELITPPTKLPAGLPDRAQATQADCVHARGDCRVKQNVNVSTQPYGVHSLDDAKTSDYRRYLIGVPFLYGKNQQIDVNIMEENWSDSVVTTQT